MTNLVEVPIENHLCRKQSFYAVTLLGVKLKDFFHAVGTTRLVLVRAFDSVLLEEVLEFLIARWVKVVVHGEDFLNRSKSQVGELTELGGVLVHSFLGNFDLGDQWAILLDVGLIEGRDGLHVAFPSLHHDCGVATGVEFWIRVSS